MTGSAGIFRKSSLERISSPEQLNDYIRVSNPSIWLVIGALIAMLGAVAAWSIWGSLPTRINASGAVINGSICCYLSPSEAAGVQSGQEVLIHLAGIPGSGYNTPDMKGVVSSVSSQPLSRSQVAAELNNDYLLQSLAVPDFSLKVSVSTGDPAPADGSIVDLGIVIDDIRPIGFLWE